MRFLSVVIMIILSLPLLGQITGPTSDAVRTTSYPGGYTPTDPVFIFCYDGTNNGRLEAEAPSGTAPYSFTWYQWSTADNDFTIHIKTDAGATHSIADNLTEGGYQVHITDGGGYDTTLIAWVHLAQPYAMAELLDKRCDRVALNGAAAPDTFYYYNPGTGQDTILPSGVSFLWSSDPTSVIPYPNLDLDPVTYTPPLEDVNYKLTVTDSFGCISESSFFYESIHVKADFTVDPLTGEAPLTVTLTDNSVRAHKHTWHFGDDTISYDSHPVSYTYYRPGTYNLKLVIESDQHCTDSLVSDNIVVAPSSLNIPNVFTPDGDGINEYFKPDITSLRSIDMQIFSRSGSRVYSFIGEGDNLSEWMGWDGTVNNSSTKASPGVYYYVIRARGWDDILYSTKEHRGFLYLYR